MPAKITDFILISNIVDDFKNGFSKTAICKKYKLSEPCVHRIIKENYKQVFSRISESTINKVIELSKIRNSKLKIAKEIKIDVGTVTKILKHYNLKVCTKVKEKIKKETEYEKLNRLFSPDFIREQLKFRSVYNLSLELKVAHGTLIKYMLNNNIPYVKSVKRVKDISYNIKESVIFDFSNQVSKKDICKRYNISSKHINTILKEFKLPTLQNKIEKYIDPSFLMYSKLARRLTTVVKNTYKLETPLGYHWDHKISIIDGYKNNIPVYLIASRENLELVPAFDNLSKGTNSSISKEDLYKLLNL